MRMEFSRKTSSDLVLFEDAEFPMRDSDDDLMDYCSQVFLENPLILPLYYQVGSGFVDQPASSSTAPIYTDGYTSENLEDAIIFEERHRKRNIKYQGEEITFRMSVDPERLPQHLRNNALVAVAESVRQMVGILIERSTQNLRSEDLIRICIQAVGLDKPISTTLMPVSSLTVEKVLSAIMKVLQSKEEIHLDEGFTADVITIRRDVGGGRNRKIINAKTDGLVKKSVLTIPSDENGMCCAMAIVYALAHLQNDHVAINAMRDRRRPALLKRARALHEAARVPLGPCTYTEIGLFEEHLDVQIVVISSDNLSKVTYKGRNRSRRINLWLHDFHYDVITSLKGFYGSNYYCEKCEKPYDHVDHHKCPGACPVCYRTICIPGDSTRCQDCDRLCRSADCFAFHKSTVGNQQLSLCDRIYQCRDCCRVVRRRDCPKNAHRCWTTKCPSCTQFVLLSEHRCFLRTTAAKTPSDNLIFFDFETEQTTGEHIVNFAVAQYANGTEKFFKGYSACHDFCEWLFTPLHKDHRAIAHNMKGFDGQFVLGWLLAQGTAPEIIPCGSKVMAITHKKLHITIIDSYNFLPMALSKLPACFGLAELKKGYFPHLFNTRENQSYVGILPEAHYYSPDTMSTSGRSTFLAWHKEHERDKFHFQEEMLAYCKSDVDILRRCCIEFRKQFLDVAGVDPFCYITIASACMAVYRSKHIQDNTIPMVPVHGYVNKTIFSSDSIRWLDFIGFSKNLKIQHALNNNGEKKIGGISVDGFCEENNTIYQYQGCFFHGCSTCYDGDTINPLVGVTMATLRKKTNRTSDRLRTLGFRVIEKWEHEFIHQKKEDVALKMFLSSHALKDRLNPRDAFFGGRTNAIKLYYEGPAKYVDFTSLYPWVNKYCRYPIGHPKVITENFADLDQYFGFIQCEVIPPRSLYFPVLPYRCNGKLMFPLCRCCAERMQQDGCEHTEEERSLSGTWVTEEMKMAVQKGYRITKIFEVYHFQNSSDSLFKSYIDLFLKIKQESNGWPEECITPTERTRYIQEYEEREGIKLDATAIAKNPGRRQVAKLALNSFWGRWGMNINKAQLTYVHTLSKFNKILSDPSKEIKDIYFPTPEVAAIHWKAIKDFVPQDSVTNIFLAAFTTAWARLKLYTEIDKLGSAVLYFDTDSVIYASDENNDPPLGNFLGEFTDELNGDLITTFVSGGPKNYGYKTAAGKTCCKVRGFTLNFRNSKKLNFHSIKNLVCSMDLEPTTIPLHNPSKICRDAKRRKVINREETKLYRIVYDKRIIQPDLSTLPYGY